MAIIRPDALLEVGMWNFVTEIDRKHTLKSCRKDSSWTYINNHYKYDDIANVCGYFWQILRRVSNSGNYLCNGIRNYVLTDSGVGTVNSLGYGMDDRGSIPRRVGFSLRLDVHTGSGSHAVSYTKNTGAISSGKKLSKLEANHSPPPSSEVKNVWWYTSTSPSTRIA